MGSSKQFTSHSVIFALTLWLCEIAVRFKGIIVLKNSCEGAIEVVRDEPYYTYTVYHICTQQMNRDE